MPVAVVAGIVLLATFCFLEAGSQWPATPVELIAVMVGATGIETDAGPIVRIMAELPDGERVIVRGLGLRDFKQGARVLVRESRSGVLGIRRYHFVRFVSPTEGAAVHSGGSPSRKRERRAR